MEEFSQIDVRDIIFGRENGITFANATVIFNSSKNFNRTVSAKVSADVAMTDSVENVQRELAKAAIARLRLVSELDDATIDQRLSEGMRTYEDRLNDKGFAWQT